MKTLGNLLWLLFGGLATALEYLVASILMMVTIIGIPFGVQSMKMASLCIWPFGADVRKKETPSGCLNTAINILWFFVLILELLVLTDKLSISGDYYMYDKAYVILFFQFRMIKLKHHYARKEKLVKRKMAWIWHFALSIWKT